MQVINLEIITSVSCGFDAFHNSTTHTACFQFLASLDGGSCRRSYHVLDLSRVKSFFKDHFRSSEAGLRSQSVSCCTRKSLFYTAASASINIAA